MELYAFGKKGIAMGKYDGNYFEEMMNFSRSGRTVDESRAWLKRIIITWAILNGLGFIMSYVTPFFADGRWNG